MNNINCEHCGSLIDTSKDIKCPNCGAPYKNNKQYKENQEFQKRKIELNLETQKIANDITKDVHNTAKKVKPIIFIIIIFIIIFVIFTFYLIFSNIKSHKNIGNELNNLNNNLNNINNLDINYSLDYNIVDESEYDLKVDKIVKYVEKKYEKEKTYYGFHITFDNKTFKWKTLGEIKLFYNDEKGNKTEAKRAIVSTEELGFFALEIKVYKGYLYYDIPNNVKDVTINYRNTNIELNDFRNKIK